MSNCEGIQEKERRVEKRRELSKILQIPVLTPMEMSNNVELCRFQTEKDRQNPDNMP